MRTYSATVAVFCPPACHSILAMAVIRAFCRSDAMGVSMLQRKSQFKTFLTAWSQSNLFLTCNVTGFADIAFSHDALTRDLFLIYIFFHNRERKLGCISQFQKHRNPSSPVNFQASVIMLHMASLSSASRFIAARYVHTTKVNSAKTKLHSLIILLLTICQFGDRSFHSSFIRASWPSIPRLSW